MIPFEEEGFFFVHRRKLSASRPWISPCWSWLEGSVKQEWGNFDLDWMCYTWRKKLVVRERTYVMWCDELAFVDFERWSIYHRPGNGCYLVSSFNFFVRGKLCSFSQGGVPPSETLPCPLDVWGLFNSSLRFFSIPASLLSSSVSLAWCPSVPPFLRGDPPILFQPKGWFQSRDGRSLVKM